MKAEKKVKKNFFITWDQQKMLTELSVYFDKTEAELFRDMIENEWINNFWNLIKKDDTHGK